MRRSATALLLLVLTACTGGDEGSGLPSNKPAMQLTPDEDMVLCDAARDYLDARIRPSGFTSFLCTFDALEEAVDPEGATAPQIARCNELRDACVAAAEPVEFTLACDGVDDWSTCGATIGEIEACYQDTIDLMQNLIKDLDCDILDPIRGQQLEAKYGDNIESPFPPSCTVVQDTCPRALGGD